MSKLTPAQKQYLQLKAKHKDAILFFRMWDFYETFYEDAKICANVLGITLTTRDKNSPNPIPMAWVPYHSADKYIANLVKAWYKVAIAEQIGEVKPWEIVKREVVKVITPWTWFEEGWDGSFNTILAITYDGKNYHIAWWDFSTWEYWTTSFKTEEDMLKFVSRLTPKETIIDIDYPNKSIAKDYLKKVLNSYISIFDTPNPPQDFLKTVLKTTSLKGWWEALKEGRETAIALLFNYLLHTQQTKLKNISRISYKALNKEVLLDDITIKNLEIFRSSYTQDERFSLEKTINKALTPMGKRIFKQLLASPTKDLWEIKFRSTTIGYFIDNLQLAQQLSDSLKNIGDIPRLIAKILYKKNSPLSWLKLKEFLDTILNPPLQTQLKKVFENLDLSQAQQLHQKINQTLKKEIQIEDKDFIREGYSPQIDQLRKLAFHSDSLLLEYANQLSNSLNFPIKIKYITNQGYFIEISKRFEPQLEKKIAALATKDPDKFTLYRRQTLKLVERYSSPYLQRLEKDILAAQQQLTELEKQILEELKDYLESISPYLIELAQKIWWIDIFVSHAIFASNNNRTQPQIDKDLPLNILQWRHPVVEANLPPEQNFVANDIQMGQKHGIIHIITWPNMWWKSTFLRQNAIAILLAHTWLRVPAKQAQIPLVSWIFARVWAGDALAQNQSTFMTEMLEVSNILNNADKNSFIILDELGRGTSTYDWLAIAQAIVEYIATNLQAKTLFATHYHELTQLEQKYPNIKNYSAAVYESGNEIVFLKKIIPGKANKSYGIEVARLAGLPPKIIDRSKEILQKLETKASQFWWVQLPLFDASSSHDPKLQKIKQKLQSIDINNITPLQALQILDEIKKLIR